MANKVLVVGVGNSWRHDDGIGPAVIKELKQLANADLLDGGIDGLALLDKISPYAKVIIIDAVTMGKEPGFVRCFAPEEVKLITQDALSTHGFGLAELITLMAELDIKTNIKVIGIQPKNVEFGEGLTTEIEQKIPEIINYVLRYSR